MKDWQIAVLVIICVIFLISAFLLGFLIYRTWLDGLPACYPGCTRKKNVLYYLDFSYQLQFVDIKRDYIHNGTALQQCLAKKLASTSPTATADWELLCLSYLGNDYREVTPSAAERTVPLDLDRLVANDAQRDARMRHTAERPLFLQLLEEVYPNSGGGTGGTVLNNPLAGCQPSTAGRPVDSIDIDVNISRAGQATPAQSQLTPSQTPAAQSLVPYSQTRRPAPPLPACSSSPKPLLFPTEVYITDQTPIFILAAHYYLYDPNGAVQVLDEVTTATLEAGMCGESTNSGNRADGSSPCLRLREGPYESATVLLDVGKGTAVLRRPGVVDCTLVRRAADHVQYCVDRQNSSQWEPFEKPLQLPPGRWCVRAQATSAFGVSPTTTAKVYTVCPAS